MHWGERLQDWSLHMQVSSMARANARAWVLRCTAWIRLNDVWHLLVFMQKRGGFLGGAVVKNPPATAGDVGSTPGLGREPLEEEMATHSSILTWRIPWTEELSRLQFLGSQRVEHDWVTEHTRWLWIYHPQSKLFPAHEKISEALGKDLSIQ